MNEAELILSETLRCKRADLYLNRNRRLGHEAGKLVAGILKRRYRGEPVYYILGRDEFMGFEFRLTPDCLIPRSETEFLVEAVVSYAKHSAYGPFILDIGTGSGCIAISIARMLPQAVIIATDISDAALAVAKDNARRLGVEGKVSFVRCDLFPPAPCNKFDFIVTNPPYIPAKDIDGLSPEVRSEPRVALDGGYDGLHFYRRIIKRANEYLRPAGTLVMEAGFGQAGEIITPYRR